MGGTDVLPLELGQGHPGLAHILAFPVGIGDLGLTLALEEQELADALVGVDLAGRGVVLLISSVTWPSHSGSSGVTFTIIPQRA